jgi:hypothetical protein
MPKFRNFLCFGKDYCGESLVGMVSVAIGFFGKEGKNCIRWFCGALWSNLWTPITDQILKEKGYVTFLFLPIVNPVICILFRKISEYIGVRRSARMYNYYLTVVGQHD